MVNVRHTFSSGCSKYYEEQRFLASEHFTVIEIIKLINNGGNGATAVYSNRVQDADTVLLMRCKSWCNAEIKPINE